MNAAETWRASIMEKLSDICPLIDLENAGVSGSKGITDPIDAIDRMISFAYDNHRDYGEKLWALEYHSFDSMPESWLSRN